MPVDQDPEDRAARLRELRERRARRLEAAGESTRSRSTRERERSPERSELSVPQPARRRLIPRPNIDSEAFGRASEAFARFMGTPQFLLYMTLFCGLWLAWNTFMPEEAQFDPRALNYTLLTLILSLQASYAAPLILLAQNRQDDRDRVSIEQDRARDERNLADTEFITREVASLRLSVGEMASRDFVRSELRDLLEELLEELDERDRRTQEEEPPEDAAQRSAGASVWEPPYDGGHVPS
ncbi:Uncharacterized membrane protein [Kytococcus aerolatus]|uniref:Uncharacterized membrane protein n=1 Tax=Kytococcus aerolatus TaxID=592308 RepID=A0A212T7N4_9MICO|nr:DUF1003 domain-containing protein [Kytococcus aerolatus]SNC62029.1 Uncharacterized membrane protein [Kytococcus aerolatus]